MARRIQLRRDTAAAWTAANPVLRQGEIGLDLTNNKIKIGDGTTAWSTLTYFDDKETNFAGYATEAYVNQAIENIDLSAVNQSIIPGTDVTYDLGSATNRFRDLYLSGNTIDLGGAKISAATDGNIVIPGVTRGAGFEVDEVDEFGDYPSVETFLHPAYTVPGTPGELATEVFAGNNGTITLDFPLYLLVSSLTIAPEEWVIYDVDTFSALPDDFVTGNTIGDAVDWTPPTFEAVWGSWNFNNGLENVPYYGIQDITVTSQPDSRWPGRKTTNTVDSFPSGTPPFAGVYVVRVGFTKAFVTDSDRTLQNDPHLYTTPWSTTTRGFYISFGVTVIDDARFQILNGNITPSSSYIDAGYVAYLENGKIEEIEVTSSGNFSPSESTLASSNNMWVTDTATNPFTNFDPNIWTQVPFRPKMRPTSIESEIGGSGDQLVSNENNNTFFMTNTGDVVFSGEVPEGAIGGGGVNRGLVWDYGAEAGGVDSMVRQDDSGLTVRAWTESGEGTYAAPVNIVTNQDANEKRWEFGGDGVLTLPQGGDIVDSNGQSVLGGGVSIDRNIWIQTFATDSGDTDKAALASSVEYDNLGNVYALFLHQQYNDLQNPSSVTGSYFSVAKFASTGEKLWSVRSSSANVYTDGWGLAVDNANSAFYVAGKTAVAESYNRSFLVKFNSDDGSQIWASTLDFGNQSDSPVVDIASDGNPVIVGYLETDDALDGVTVTKINRTDGSILWSQLLDGQGDDEAYGMAVGPSGEIVAVGYTSQIGVTDAADGLYADLAGNLNWTVGGSIDLNGVTADFTFTDGFPTFTNIVDTVGGRTIDAILGTVLGSTIGGVDGVDDMVVKVETVAANDTDDRMLVVKYDSDGGIVWQKAIQFDAGYDCYGADADIDADGNVYINGNYRYESGQAPFPTSAMSIVKFDSAGVKQWSRRVVGDCDDFTTSIVVSPENTLYLTGVTTRPGDTDKYIWVVAKYTTSGTVVWQRLIENNSNWSFSGGFFGSSGGGSSLAVKEGYVALSGAFGVPFDGLSTATLVQLDFDGTVFTVGDWEVKAASFSGVLSSDASDITVINAGKTDSSLAGTITIDDSVFAFDDSNFLIPTLYRSTAGGNTGDITFDGVNIIGRAASERYGLINLVPALTADDGFNNINFLDSGQYVSIYPTNAFDAPHIHIAAGIGLEGEGDLFLGDDNKYVSVNSGGNIRIQSFNSETNIGQQWNFGTDGNLTFPNATVQSTAWAGIPGPYADDSEAATAGVAIGYPYHKTGTSGQVFVRLA